MIMPDHILRNLSVKLGCLFSWEVLRHPAYSPDFVPSDYHLFRSMNNALQGVGFQTFQDVRKWVDNFFASKSQEFFREGIHELSNRWQEVLDGNGEYFDD